MSGVMTKWSVAQDRTVHDGDLSREGYLTEETLGRWIDSAIAAYLDGDVSADDMRASRSEPISRPLTSTHA